MAADEEEGRSKPKRKKRRRTKKAKGTTKKGAARKRRKGTSTDASPPEAPRDDDRGGRPWWALVLLIALVELYVFGSRGAVELCVAKEGEHDFALLGQERTPDNTRRFPTCETRLNIGLVSHHDEVREEAMYLACRRATVFRGQEALLRCVEREEGWTHRLASTFVPPWDRRYYRRLLWFLF